MSSPSKFPSWATHAALLIVQIAFASQAVEAKVAMAPRAEGGEAMAPAAIAMIRMIAGALFFHLFVAATRARKKTTWRDQRSLVLLSVLGISLNQALFLAGLRLTKPFAGALLAGTIPVFAAALSVLFRREVFSWRTVIGLSLSVSGVFVLTGIVAIDKGALMVSINCLAYAAYLVFSRGIIQRLGALTVMAWVFTWGALLFLPLGLPSTLASLPELTARGVRYISYIVLFPTIVAYLLNAWALGRSSATLVTIYIYLQPLLAALLAWVQLGHGLTQRMIGASALIFCGVAVVVLRGSKAPLGAPAFAKEANESTARNAIE